MRYAPPTICSLLLLFGLAPASDGQAKPIDTKRSSLTIHVGKAGLLSAASHEHRVTAPIASGSIADSGTNPRIHFVVKASGLSINRDGKLSEQERSEVQSHMQDEVLESAKYPEIGFVSSSIHESAPNAWKVEGLLTLHGKTKPLFLDVARRGDAYVGKAHIKQTGFGIRPIQIAGGLVRVKDELEILFEIYTTSHP